MSLLTRAGTIKQKTKEKENVRELQHWQTHCIDFYLLKCSMYLQTRQVFINTEFIKKGKPLKNIDFLRT